MTGINCTGIILAGGKSLRMGEEKGLVNFEGKPMIEHAISFLEPLVSNIIISSNSDKYNYLSKLIVKDHILNCGPGAGIVAALNKSTTDVNIIVPCDMPHLNREFMEYILSKRGDFEAIVPVLKSEPEPLCVVMKKKCAISIKAELEKGVYKLSDIYRSLDVNYLEISGDEPGYKSNLFNNYNSSADMDSQSNNLSSILKINSDRL
ncbi:MAG: molybdenum cofactor guanylyltransferase [Bacteroidetes bacterium]|nr:molybdenum cofactor guanylyltransferase [Bacteroidota bacterium]